MSRLLFALSSTLAVLLSAALAAPVAAYPARQVQPPTAEDELRPDAEVSPAETTEAPALPAPPPAPPGRALVTIDGRRLQVPVTLVAGRPLFALAPLAERLGAGLRPTPRANGFVLDCGGEQLLLGADSSVVVKGQELIELERKPVMGPAGLEVPLDLLERCFGEGMGYGFVWSPEARRLVIDRALSRRLTVDVEVVNLGGATTVVLTFPEEPRYRLHEEWRRAEVELVGDRLVPSPVPRVDDPLVERILIRPERITIYLAPGAEASSYVLSSPFRLVFDVNPAQEQEPIVEAPVRPRRREGVHKIVIDPGHGGAESGATGTKGSVEKDLTLMLARSLARRLEQRLPVKVILTRSEDTELPLETRPAIANENKGDLFISLHLNSSLGGSSPHGAETYFLSPQASDDAAQAAATAENRPAAGGDPLDDLELILWDLTQSRYLAESQRLAMLIQEELNGVLGIKNRGVKQAPFRVLMGAAMPAVLVELGFLSNPEEETRLLDPSYRGQLIDAVVRAVSRYREATEAVEEAGR